MVEMNNTGVTGQLLALRAGSVGLQSEAGRREADWWRSASAVIAMAGDRC